MVFNSKPNKDGGYCPRCDTVWASPGKCRCEENNKNVEIKNVPVEIANDIWNAAIEAAARTAIENSEGIEIAVTMGEEIRKLKK